MQISQDVIKIYADKNIQNYRYFRYIIKYNKI